MFYMSNRFESIRKKLFIEFESDYMKVFWKKTLVNTEKDLLETLCVGICERMFSIETKFWDELYQLEKNNVSIITFNHLKIIHCNFSMVLLYRMP